MTPREWEPTGTPVEQVMWPAIAPRKGNRTAVIWNNALGKNDKWFGVNLWLTKVSTGWALGGSYGQAQRNRIFYPRNLSQHPITIEGVMPNQHEYDKLVMFVKTHHQLALNSATKIQQALTFALPAALIKLPGSSLSPYRVDAYWDGDQIVRRYYRSMYVDGYITGIQAGHPRWNFMPKFTMDLMVSYDYIDEKVELANQMTNLIQSKGATYAQDNATISKNYQALLRIQGQGSVNDPSQNVTDDKEFLDNAVNQTLNPLGVATWIPS